MSLFQYPSRQKSKWPALANTPFKPDSALARSFKETSTLFWEGSHHQDMTAFAWLLWRPSSPHQADWMGHLLRCGASPTTRGGKSLWGRHESASPAETLLLAIAGKGRGALIPEHAEHLWKAMVQHQQAQKSGDPWLGYLELEALMETQRLDLLLELFPEGSPLQSWSSLHYTLTSSGRHGEFRAQAAQALVAQGLTWGAASIALPHLLTAAPGAPSWWLPQLFKAWDEAANRGEILALDGPWHKAWRQTLGRALLWMDADSTKVLREGLEARVAPERRALFAPEFPAFLKSESVYAFWWEASHWEQVPGLVKWALEWGLRPHARLPDGATWTEHLTLQWEKSDRFGHSNKDMALPLIWESLELLAHGGYRLSTPAKPELIKRVREIFDVKLSMSLQRWVRDRELFDPPFHGTVQRLEKLIKVAALSRKLPQAQPEPRPKPRF